MDPVTDFIFCWMEALSVHWDHCRAMGYTNRGEGDIGPGRNGRRPGEAQTPAGMDASLQPAAVANCPAGNSRSSLSRWTTSIRPVLRSALVDWDDVWVGQTKGSVA